MQSTTVQLFMVIGVLACGPAVADDYYNKPCSAQAEDARALAAMRDRGNTREQTKDAIAKNYPGDHVAALQKLSDSVYTLRSSTPQQIYSTAFSSCIERGQGYAEKASAVGVGRGDEPRLTAAESKNCLSIVNELKLSRDRLLNYDKTLSSMNADLERRRSQVGSSGSQSAADLYNAEVTKFQRTKGEYEQLSQSYNEQTELFTRRCAGKALN